MNNVFFSYHHSSNLMYLKKLREIFKNRTFSDYGFNDEDLGESSKYDISYKIQYRLWSSSVVVVLIGSETGNSEWIDWEIWYSLQNIQSKKAQNVTFKPKGLVALYLPVEKHNVPERLQKNIDSGYAKELRWKDLEDNFYSVIEMAYNARTNIEKIIIGPQPRVNPRKNKRFQRLYWSAKYLLKKIFPIKISK
ncbi:TIR domain-containing protein [Portibacter marinus]|uniref:TIR domain-containing protein n=1 Tax=Portibacter marinus TaxID=2898660 RepID=UPI001F48AB0A|nr:TIR domain-containing protein [Portibacter marinus]